MPHADLKEQLRQHWHGLTAASPQAPAIDWLGEVISFRELGERVEQERARLEQLIEPGTGGPGLRLGVQIPNGPENLVSGLALALEAMPQTILPVTATPTEQEQLERRLDLSHRLGVEPPATEGPWQSLGQLPSGLHCWKRMGHQRAAAQEQQPVPEEPDAFLGTTSGTSTGMPSLVRMPVRALLHNGSSHSPYRKVSTPLLGEGLQNWSARLYKLLHLFRGGAVVIRELDRPFQPGVIPSHCDGMPMPPNSLRTHVAWDDLRHCPEGFLLISGSDRVPMALRRAVLASGPVRLGITYATSQSGPITWLPPEAVLDEHESVGWPLPGVELEPSGPVRLERDGLRFQEVTVRAPGYSPFNPGDLLAISPSGQVIFGGRSNDVFLFASVLISPFEIEEVLNAHPGVEQCVAFGARSERYGAVPMAVVLVKPGHDQAALLAELDRQARAALGPRRPQRITVVDAIPCGPTGKPLRRVLSEQFALSS